MSSGHLPSQMSVELTSLRRKASEIERQLEQKFKEYEQVAQRISRRIDEASRNGNGGINRRSGDLEGGGEGDRDDKEAFVLETQIPSLLASLKGIISQMTTIIQGPSNNLTSSSGGGTNAVLLKRYMAISTDYDRDFKSQNNNLTRKRQSQELFASSSSSLHINNGGGDGDNSSEMDSLMNERQGLSKSLSLSSQILNQASASLASLRSQKANLVQSHGKVSFISSMQPRALKVIEGIRKKKGRDNAILAGVIATGILVVMWYWVG